MIDTSTVNYTICKMTEAFAKVMPQIEGVTSQYVDYVVTKTVCKVFVWLMICIVLAAVTFFFCKKWNDWESIAPPFAVVAGIYTLVVAIITTCNIYFAVLAVKFPEMYVIHRLLNASK